MATLCEAYSSPEAARRAVDALRHVGIPERDIRLLIGSSYHDVRSERAGGFALPVDPDAPFGKYSGPPRLRRQAAGGFAGVPDRQRQGSFGDVDRNVSVTYDDGFERSHVARDSGVAGWLRAAHLTGDVADHLLDELHQGHAVLLAEVAEPDVRDAKARLQNMANGA